MNNKRYGKEIISTEKAPRAIGPYSAGVSTGDLVFTAGQLGIDPVSGKMVPGGIQAQTRQALNNLKPVLEVAGSGLGRVIKRVAGTDGRTKNGHAYEVYGTFFKEECPARSAVQVAALPLGAVVEIEAVALIPDD